MSVGVGWSVGGGIKPLSMELRERVEAAWDAGEHTQQEGADRFGVSPSTVRRLLARRAATGSVAAKPAAKGFQSRVDAAARGVVRGLVADQPARPELAEEDATPDERRGRLADRAGETVTLPRVPQVLQELGLPRKISRPRPASKSAARCEGGLRRVGGGRAGPGGGTGGPARVRRRDGVQHEGHEDGPDARPGGIGRPSPGRAGTGPRPARPLAGADGRRGRAAGRDVPGHGRRRRGRTPMRTLRSGRFWTSSWRRPFSLADVLARTTGVPIRPRPVQPVVGPGRGRRPRPRRRRLRPGRMHRRRRPTRQTPAVSRQTRRTGRRRRPRTRRHPRTPRPRRPRRTPAPEDPSPPRPGPRRPECDPSARRALVGVRRSAGLPGCPANEETRHATRAGAESTTVMGGQGG